MNQQLPLDWTPPPPLPQRLRDAGRMYAWLFYLLHEAAKRIEELENREGRA